MNLVVITALIAVCGAAKLDRTYLPPSSATSAGGSPGSLQAPFTRTSEQGLETPNSPTGSYSNEFEGVVVDAALGTRSSEGLSGLGGPRPSYGSSASKVGDAAFRGSAGFRGSPFGTSGQTGAPSEAGSEQFGAQGNSFSNGQIDTHSQGFPSNGQIGSQTGQFNQGFQENKSERPQAAKDRNSNILSLSNDVDTDGYSYGFETDNGIAIGENGVAVNGIQAEGGYSYQGDDGQVYKVTYVADEGGYRPQGAHLPTPPPIPAEILKSLEQNAKEEAAGLVDDGSYNPQKYNADADYSHDNGNGNIQHNGAQLSQFGKRPGSDATFNNQNTEAFAAGSANFGFNAQAQAFNGQSSQVNGNNGFGAASNLQNSFGHLTPENRKPGQFTSFGSLSSFNGQATQVNKQPDSSQFGPESQAHSTFGQSTQVNKLDSNAADQNGNFGSQTSHSSQQLSRHGSSATGHTQAAQGAFGQTQFGSQFSQQASAHFQNQSPESDSQQNQQGFNNQFGSSSKTSPGQDASNSANPQSTQPQSGTSFKPQGSEAFSGASLNQEQDGQDFGKPSPQAFSGQNFNRPSVGNFNKLAFGQSQANKGSASNFNRFPQAPSRFGASNEYIPPSNNGQLQANRPAASALAFTSNTGFSGSGKQSEQKENIPDFEALNRPKPNFASASASTSSGQPTFQPQPARPLNAFGTQPKPNQFSQQTTQINQQQSSAQTPAQFNTNSQQSGVFAAQSVKDFGSKPTAVPDTELTTPLEPNETPTSQGSQFSSQSTPSFGSFGPKPTSSSQAQAQFGFQENSAFGQQSTSQTLSPSAQTSSPHTNSQFSAIPTQSTFQSSVEKEPENFNGQPQFPQNSFSQTQQNQQNSFGQAQQNQPSFNQGVDNSYYYNQPTKTFGTPSVRPQGSRFPSSPSYQFNRVAQNSFNQQSFQSSTKFPDSPSLAPVGSTSATQLAQSQGYNGITQAAISSFPSAFPTSSSQFGTTQNGQFGNKLSFNQQSSVNNQAQPTGTQPSYSQQSTFGNQVQKTTNQDKFQNPRLPIGRFPLSYQFASQGNQPQSTEDKTSNNQLSAFGNQGQTIGDQQNNRIPTPPIGRFPPGFQLSKLAQSAGTKAPYNQQSTFGSQSQTGNQDKPRFPPLPTAQFSTNTQIGQQPASSGSQFGPSGTPESSNGSQQTQTQQYQGTIYEYNKPAEVLPANTQPDSSSSQTIQSSITSESQNNQLLTQENSKPFSQLGETDSKVDAQNTKPFGGASSSFQFGQHAQTGHGNQNTETQFGSQSAKPFNEPSTTNIQFGQSAQFGAQPGKPVASSTTIKFGQTAQLTPESSSLPQNTQGSTAQPFKPFGSFGSASQGSQSSFGSKPQFGSQTQFTQNTQSFGSSKTSQPEDLGAPSQLNSQTVQSIVSSQSNGYFYPSNPKPQFTQESKNQFGQNTQSGRPQSGSNQFNHAQSGHIQGNFNQQSQFNSASRPQFGTQNNQNIQATFGQKLPNSPIQSFGLSQFKPTASSQAFASGQATASASASTSDHKPFGSQDTTQFGQAPTPNQDQSGQGTQVGENVKPFGAQESNEAPSSKPFGTSSQGSVTSKPLFKSPCCQGSKDSSPAQSTDRPSSSFPGTQGFNTQSSAGKGEQFGGPRQPPRFDDQTGYHY